MFYLHRGASWCSSCSKTAGFLSSTTPFINTPRFLLCSLLLSWILFFQIPWSWSYTSSSSFTHSIHLNFMNPVCRILSLSWIPFFRILWSCSNTSSSSFTRSVHSPFMNPVCRSLSTLACRTINRRTRLPKLL